MEKRKEEKGKKLKQQYEIIKTNQQREILKECIFLSFLISFRSI